MNVVFPSYRRSHRRLHRVVARVAARFVPLVASVSLGCHDASTAPVKEVPVGTVIGHINSISFSVVTGVYVTYQRGVLSISAMDETQRSIQMALLAPDRPGTISVSPGVGSSAFTGYQHQLWRSNIEGGSGSVTFTSVTFNQAAGTFSFRAAAVPGTSSTGVVNVSGSFNVTYDHQ